MMLVIPGLIYHNLDAQQMAITICTGGAWEMFMGINNYKSFILSLKAT